MPSVIVHSKPTIGEKEFAAAGRYLKRGELTMGAAVEAFEDAFSKRHEGHLAVAVNSGSAGLHLSLLALDIGPGDEVVVPSYVCVALLNAVGYVRARPRVVDIDLDDYSLSPKALAEAVGKRTRAVIVPHMYGKPAKMAEIRAIVKEYRLVLIEDCAQAVGATFDGRPVGVFGDLAVFSFYSTKVMTTGHGGMVLVSRESLARRLRDLRAYDKKPSARLRFNYGMTDFQAAMGTVQLRKLASFIRRRRAIARRYTTAFAPHDVEVPIEDPHRLSIYYRYVLKIPRGSRSFLRAMNEEGIHCTRGVYRPLHRYMGLPPRRYPNTEGAMRRSVSLPIYPGLNDKECRRVIEAARALL
ncbi:DegT/DnrJ/EryC1/StrS family aminotransferase [Nitrospinae bacterium AH_259_B05_G02_I21]|nr:DegT/DnrJ/EryC1/StrS family aminotransferase [Nitrospinae bacterium AH_259_B05_G02_I21]MDA2931658.1 DegT/DnrJ/EryC1/StrS family aminotransferase [Nitrospinae bacterium AH-259-F20]